MVLRADITNTFNPYPLTNFVSDTLMVLYTRNITFLLPRVPYFYVIAQRFLGFS